MKLFLVAILISLGFPAFAQQITVSGKITDEHNAPVPFASIYIKNTTKGTSANSEGLYSLQLTPGTYEIAYRAVGYKQESRKIVVTASQVINVVLATEAYELQGVRISSGEDPAYAIIRKTIKKT